MKAHTDRALRMLFVEHMRMTTDCSRFMLEMDITGKFYSNDKEQYYQTYRQGYLLGYEQAGRGV